jgi:plastocyanin
MKRFVVAAAAGWLLASGTVLAGGAAGPVIQGRVVGSEKLVPKVYAEAAADPHRHRLREVSAVGRQGSHDLSANVSRDVCIAAFGAAAAAHEPVSLRVTGGRLTPSTIVVSPGTRVSFENVDPFPHELFEVGEDKWAPSPMGSRATRAWTATSPGLHQIRDLLFPSVAMYIVVDARAVEFGTPNREGAFSLSVPPGDYSINAFFEGRPVGKEIDGIHLQDKGFSMNDPINVAGGDAR